MATCASIAHLLPSGLLALPLAPRFHTSTSGMRATETSLVDCFLIKPLIFPFKVVLVQLVHGVTCILGMCILFSLAY
jgi:hypothetical protein